MSAFKSLSLGPGRPHELERLMRAQDPSRPIQRLTDLAELLQCPSGRVLLDGARLPAEDFGILRRALQSGDRVFTILGGDPSTGTLRELLKHPRAAWLPYPPDSEELSQLIGPALFPSAGATPAESNHNRGREPEAAPEHPPEQEPARPVESDAQPQHAPTKADPPRGVDLTPPRDPNLAEIEAILSQPAAAFQTGEAVAEPAIEPLMQPPSPPEVGRVHAPAGDDAPATTEATTELPPAAPEQTAPAEQKQSAQQEPTWFKDQVADLADIVQTVYSSTSIMSEDGADPPPGLLADSMRLVQFTRTLGFLAAPPGRGETRFDLGELSEELLRSAGAASDAPRFLLKISEPLPVRGDKELIVQALDAILVLARLCAGPEGEVRLSGQKTEGGGSSILLGFPKGPLQDMTPAEIVRPYSLRALLPDMGKNALRAASRIIEGQGGSMTLDDPGGDLLRYALSLPSP